MHNKTVIPNCFKIMLTLFITLTLLLPGMGSVHASPPPATFTVTNTNNGGAGSLRQAMIDAIATPADDTITFSVSGTIILVTRTPVITAAGGKLTIDGTGRSVTIDGDGSVPGLKVDTGAALDLKNLTIFNGLEDGGATNYAYGGGVYNLGTLNVTNCTFSGNWASSQFSYGGGIYNSDGSVTITNSTFSSNTARSAESQGGGIFTSGGTLDILNSTFSGNNVISAGSDPGGALYISGTTVTITNSTFSGNHADDNGGAVYVASGTVTITKSTFSSNYVTKGSGGGIYNNSGSLTINNSTFSSNAANGASSNGGGIYIGSSATTSVNNSTLSGNTVVSSGYGGGLYNNSANTSFTNIIITNSTGDDCAGVALNASSLTNLNNDSSCSPGFTSKTPAELALGPLTGSPAYFPLTSGSSAIDAGDNISCLATDQRGMSRPLDGDGDGTATCDVGSYEMIEPTTTSITADTPDPSLVGANVNVSVTVNATNTPTGKVNITGADVNCSITLSGGSGSCPVRFNSVGAKTLTATYTGNATHSGSSDTAGHTVQKAYTTTTITSDNPDPSISGQSVTVNFTVTVNPPGSGTPTGAVTVSDGAASCSASVAAGSCNLVLKLPGARTLNANYPGDAKFRSSSTTESHQVNPLSANFRSVGIYDGWLLESSETSNIGGSFDSTSTTFNLGDDQSNKQYRSILSFDSSSLPDTAVVTSVVLKIKKQGLVGTDPFTNLAPLRADIRKPYFGPALALAASDFQAVAGKSSAATFGVPPSAGWYTATLNSIAYPHINKLGTTQFRLRFQLDDDNDNAADYMKFFSGNYPTTTSRPLLLIQYYIP